MKKFALIFSLAFCAFVISASAQTTATTEKESAATEKVDCGVGAKAKSKSCCAHSSKASCYGKDKSEAKNAASESPAKSDAVVRERKAVAAAEAK